MTETFLTKSKRLDEQIAALKKDKADLALSEFIPALVARMQDLGKSLIAIEEIYYGECDGVSPYIEDVVYSGNSMVNWFVRYLRIEGESIIVGASVDNEIDGETNLDDEIKEFTADDGEYGALIAFMMDKWATYLLDPEYESLYDCESECYPGEAE